MPLYSFTIEDGVPVAPDDATEELADNREAMDQAKLIAIDLARSNLAHNRMNVVVRDAAGNEVGRVPLVEGRA